MKFILVVTCLMSVFPLIGQEHNSLLESLKKDVLVLAHDSLEGREMGTAGEVKAANYISSRFSAIGLMPLGSEDSYFQVFKKKMQLHPHDTLYEGTELIGRNIIGYYNANVASTIIIGAHYDHLGYGDEGSLHVGERSIHNGADDNASGVAGLLMLANKAVDEKWNQNVIFIAFTGEEKGLLGSNYFVKESLKNFDSISYMINLDMIGRLDSERRIAVHGVGTSPSFNTIFNEVENFQIKIDSSGIGPSDHTSFYLENIPVLFFFTGQHEDYHKPTDDSQLLNYDGIIDVVELVNNCRKLLSSEALIEFTQTKDKNEQKFSFNVTLGIIPDYLFDGLGLKVDGVKPDRPGANSGLEKGDIILRMDIIEIKSIQDYMKALSVFQKTQEIRMIVDRNGERIELNVKF